MSKTRVITLMFHRVNDKSLNFSPQLFAKYLSYLVSHFPIVTPGEKLPNVPLAICLTFDDAYFDFYHDVYPLLMQHHIKALLAVPVKYIVEKTSLTAEVRLSVPYAHNMEDAAYQAKVPFCTWEELKEMAQSEHVVIASHGYRHANLKDKTTNIDQEIRYSKKYLEEKLNLPVAHFVYPFGRVTRSIHKKVCQNYDFGIRIGSALNIAWDLNRRFVYRINADPLWLNQTEIGPKLIRQLTFKYWNNRIRFF